MLSQNVNQRPTINQILKQPIISKRIHSFLTENTFKDEFSHTILHKKNEINQPMTNPISPDPNRKSLQNNRDISPRNLVPLEKQVEMKQV